MAAAGSPGAVSVSRGRRRRAALAAELPLLYPSPPDRRGTGVSFEERVDFPRSSAPARGAETSRECRHILKSVQVDVEDFIRSDGGRPLGDCLVPCRCRMRVEREGGSVTVTHVRVDVDRRRPTDIP